MKPCIHINRCKKIKHIPPENIGEVCEKCEEHKVREK